MAKRVCANCGKEKEVSGGKICEKDHFICSSCASGRTQCPVDKTKMK